MQQEMASPPGVPGGDLGRESGLGREKKGEKDSASTPQRLVREILL